jgi:hypothetical protein
MAPDSIRSRYCWSRRRRWARRTVQAPSRSSQNPGSDMIATVGEMSDVSGVADPAALGRE